MLVLSVDVAAPVYKSSFVCPAVNLTFFNLALFRNGVFRSHVSLVGV